VIRQRVIIPSDQGLIHVVVVLSAATAVPF
jgi:hypothetical protein